MNGEKSMGRLTHLYIVRHCQASGQEPEAPLTQQGQAQATELVRFLSNKGIERIVSSPYKRAIQSIAPLAQSLQLEVETDTRLVERVLSTTALPDWRARLR